MDAAHQGGENRSYVCHTKCFVSSLNRTVKPNLIRSNVNDVTKTLTSVRPLVQTLPGVRTPVDSSLWWKPADFSAGSAAESAACSDLVFHPRTFQQGGCLNTALSFQMSHPWHHSGAATCSATLWARKKDSIKHFLNSATSVWTHRVSPVLFSVLRCLRLLLSW